MSDTPRKEQVEQQNERVEQSIDRIIDLPNKAVTDQDAQTVKGGAREELPKESMRAAK
jgi:hypothetical protein